jgi:hypothetical protein
MRRIGMLVRVYKRLRNQFVERQSHSLKQWREKGQLISGEASMDEII